MHQPSVSVSLGTLMNQPYDSIIANTNAYSFVAPSYFILLVPLFEIVILSSQSCVWYDPALV